MIPLFGVGISASTLSVPISNSISSVAMVSPTPFRHSKIVPSVIDSPILGITTSTTIINTPIILLRPQQYQTFAAKFVFQDTNCMAPANLAPLLA